MSFSRPRKFRKLAVGCCLVALITHFASGAEAQLATVREAFGKFDTVSGSVVGFAGQPGAFYKLEKYRQTWGTWSDTPYLMEQFLKGVIQGEYSDLPKAELAAWREVLNSVPAFLRKRP